MDNLLDMDSRVEAILKALLWSDLIMSGILLILSPWLHLLVPWVFPIAWMLFIPLLLIFAIDEESLWKLTTVILVGLGGIIWGINGFIVPWFIYNYPSSLVLLFITLVGSIAIYLIKDLSKMERRRSP